MFVLITVDGMSLGHAMREMQSRFGSTWSGFVPNIDKSSDSPLETAIKGIIRGMIQTLPADRIKIAEIVDRLAELQAQYGDASSTRSDSRTATISPTLHLGKQRIKMFVLTIFLIIFITFLQYCSNITKKTSFIAKYPDV